MKINRKLKKKLKNIILSKIDPVWRSSDVCIKHFGIPMNLHWNKYEFRFRNKAILHWTLGL